MSDTLLKTFKQATEYKYWCPAVDKEKYTQMWAVSMWRGLALKIGHKINK